MPRIRSRVAEQESQGCGVSAKEAFQAWLTKRKIEDVEALVRKTLGDEFVTLYCSLKEGEYREFQSIITPWEREILLLNV